MPKSVFNPFLLTELAKLLEYMKNKKHSQIKATECRPLSNRHLSLLFMLSLISISVKSFPSSMSRTIQCEKRSTANLMQSILQFEIANNILSS